MKVSGESKYYRVSILIAILLVANFSYSLYLSNLLSVTKKTYDAEFSAVLAQYEYLSQAEQQRLDRMYTGNPFATELWAGQMQSENITGMHYYTDISGTLNNRTDFIAKPFLMEGYTIFNESGVIYAKNMTTGQIDFSGTNPSTVIEAAITQIPFGEGYGIHFLAGQYRTVRPIYVNNSAGITISGEAQWVRINPAVGEFAFVIGDGGVTVNSHITIKDIVVESVSGAGNGILINDSERVYIANIRIYNCGIGIQIMKSGHSNIFHCDITGFEIYGIYYPSPAVLSADHWVDDTILGTSNASAIGIYSGEKVNGLRFTNLLIGGADVGMAYGIQIRGSYSGGWLSNVVIDQVSGTAVRFESGVSYECLGFQIINCWFAGSGEHGLEIAGTNSQPIENFLISNCKFELSDYACVVISYAYRFSFTNCHIEDGGLGNLAQKNNTCLYIADNTRMTSFEHCWFGWYVSAPANRPYPVEVVCDNGTAAIATAISVRFLDCYVRDPSQDNSSRIQYHRETVNDHVRLWGRDCATSNFDVGGTLMVRDAGQAADVADEHECQIGLAFNW